jgi:predicted acylesterase/phospholipase RssA
VVVAADLESGRPVRFGLPEHPSVRISRAVQASTALPGVYPPVDVGGRKCVDGVLLKTLHASVALEEGVDLLLCINPIVPIDATMLAARGVLPAGALLERGLPAVLSQTFRTLVHSRLEVGMASYGERYPGTDVVLFEPGRDAHEMFFGNLFSLEARHEVCALAYRTTRRQLRERAAELEPIFARHGIDVRWNLLKDDDRDMRAGLPGTQARPRPRARRRKVTR